MHFKNKTKYVTKNSLKHAKIKKKLLQDESVK